MQRFLGLSILVAALASCKEEVRFTAPAESFTQQTARIEGQASERIVARVDSTFFSSSMVKPLLGRSIMPPEYSQGVPVAILSHAFWSEGFQQNPAVIGSRLTVDDVPVTVIGVMPDGVDFPKGVVLWLPRN
jgi:hypothetical protein